MTHPTPTPSRERNLMLDLALALIFMAGIGLAGCRTAPSVNPEKPVEVVLFVKADKCRWQNSGLRARSGEIVHCIAEGRWHNHNGTYGPEGNPELLKDHLGIIAPANALLMKIDYHTNTYLLAQVVLVGKEATVIANANGPILFANNISLPVGNYGEIKVTVTVAPDTDKDGISDYDEITIWKTDPAHADSNGNGFTDHQEVAEQKAQLKKKTVPPLP